MGVDHQVAGGQIGVGLEALAAAVVPGGPAGLSGPAIFPIALRMVYQVCGAVKIPVVGLGGIAGWQDAAAFLMAGATAVQVGTANFIKPDICLDIIDGLEQFLKDQGCRSVGEIIGAARG